MAKGRKKKKRKERTYQHKAIEMAQEHWEKQRKKAIHDRRTFHGL